MAAPRHDSQAFAKQCIRCQDEAISRGKSVGAYCQGDCTAVYENEVCDQSGENCRPGPEGNATAAPPASKSVTASSALDVPVMEEGGDGQMANCASSTVAGLKANGDGFLAVRSGPGAKYRKLDELHNGDEVVVFQNRGKWAGIVYRTPDATCHSTKTHAVTYPNKGWVNVKWLRPLAG
jgi:hypothetical protein